MTVDELIDLIIKKEGGTYVDNKNDSGGPTRYGITQRTLSLARHNLASPEDVASLTRDQAIVIYKNMYYYGARVNELPEALQPCIFDTGVNCGVGEAATTLQEVLNMAECPCTVDGLVGPETILAAQTGYNKMGSYLVNALCDYRVWYYSRLAEVDTKDKEFLDGWLKRANSFRVGV